VSARILSDVPLYGERRRKSSGGI